MKHIQLFEDFINESTNSDFCILVIGDNIKDNGTKDRLLPKYNEALIKFNERPRPSTEPSIWKMIKNPHMNENLSESKSHPKTASEFLDLVNSKIYELEGLVTTYFITGENDHDQANEVLELVRKACFQLDKDRQKIK